MFSLVQLKGATSLGYKFMQQSVCLFPNYFFGKITTQNRSQKKTEKNVAVCIREVPVNNLKNDSRGFFRI